MNCSCGNVLTESDRMSATAWACRGCGKVTREGRAPLDVRRTAEEGPRSERSHEQAETGARRSAGPGLVAAVIGGILTLLLWGLFGAEDLVPQLGLAFVGFAVGHGLVALGRMALG